MVSFLARPPSRRDTLRWGLLGLGASALGGSLAGCGGSSSSIRFLQNKPEVIEYFGGLVKDFNASQSEVRVNHDATTTALTPQFVRGTPPDVACYNYNLETANFLSRGALTDLSDVPAASTIRDDVQDLVDQFAQFEGRTSVLPYSVTAAGCIYNIGLFEKHDVAVPKTWPELIEACKTFQKNDVLPLYTTFLDGWTLRQGIFDCVSGSNLDVTTFFERLKELGGDAGPDAEVSFTKDFADAARRMVELFAYSNRDAGSRNYNDGNAAFARGDVAMLLQGPWAIGEISQAAPDLRLGTFALPGSDDPGTTKVRVNLDLALWIPEQSGDAKGARQMVSYLMQPSVMNAYNAKNLATSPIKNPPQQRDPRLTGLDPYIRSGRFYQGAGTYISESIPLPSYLQDLFLTKDVDGFLRRLDGAWARRAQRAAA
ncbi:ABC transporter substrate-binding protein [Demetria terragena]|uniref:ABC transporter substrate-binding protein n=1 Tax=Demetria terragena TaxID=63959 RepID=UPI00036647AB|nr:extracellular solute-binding protein [Demetria terragena]